MFGLFKDLVPLGQWAGTLDGASVKTGIVAAGVAQGTATALTASFNTVGTSAVGETGVRLPVPTGVGETVMVLNIDAADAVLVYPAVGGKINALADNASLSVAVGKGVLFVAVSKTAWVALLTA